MCEHLVYFNVLGIYNILVFIINLNPEMEEI